MPALRSSASPRSNPRRAAAKSRSPPARCSAEMNLNCLQRPPSPMQPTLSAAVKPSLVIGKVKILKRGDPLPVEVPEPPSVVPQPSPPVYAGPAYLISSPEPGAVPQPSLLLRRAVLRSVEAAGCPQSLLHIGQG